ncbi:tyrosine-type recombinase/integrase [Aurantimicrobium minutum]|nr:site-specific integrase [Aurantimicrobium minutum]
MVSQKVSQSGNFQKNLSQKSPCRTNTTNGCDEILNTRSDRQDLYGVPAQPLELEKVNSNGLSVSRFLDESVLITEYTTQPNSVTDESAAEIKLTSRNRGGSTAPTPSSREGVSGMPQIGNGSIFESKTARGKTVWKVEISIGTDFRGKRKRVRRTAHSYTEAIKLQRSMLLQLEQGTLGQRKTESFRQYSNWWLENVKPLRVRTSTLTDYQDRLIRNVYPAFGDRRLSDITPVDIEEWLVFLARQGKSTATINGAKQVLGAVLEHAFRQGKLSRNPAAIVTRLPKRHDEPTRVKSPWTKKEVQYVLEASHNTNQDLFVHLALIFGLRRGEILGLKWEDFDFPNGILHIRRSLKEERSINSDGSGSVKLAYCLPKTKSSARKLYLTPLVLASIQRHREFVMKLKNSAGNSWQEHDCVFPSSIGTPVSPSNMVKAFKAFLLSNQIRAIRAHDMRHTAAVLGLEAGVRIEAVSQGLGHSRIDVTKSVYAPHVQPLMAEFTIGVSEYIAPEDEMVRVREVCAS